MAGRSWAEFRFYPPLTEDRFACQSFGHAFVDEFPDALLLFLGHIGHNFAIRFARRPIASADSKVTNRRHYDAASTCITSVRLSSRHRCTNGTYASSGSLLPRGSRILSATRSTVTASPSASNLSAMQWSAKRVTSVSSGRPKMRAHTLTSTSLAIFGFGDSGA